MDSSSCPSDKRLKYFIQDYWDISFGVIATFTAFYFHTSGSIFLSSISSALAIVFFSITVSEIAEILADRLKEPFGSFILTFSAVSVEILLLFMVLLKSGGTPASVETVKGGIISAVIVDMNLLLGLSVFLGGLAFKQQTHNEETSGSYTTILLVTAASLLVPSILAMTEQNSKSIYSASVLISILLFAYYIVILIFQTKTHINFFRATARSRILRYKKRKQQEDEEDEEDEYDHYVFDRLRSEVNFFIMLMFIVVIGFLSEIFAEDGMISAADFGVSAGLGGLIIAFIAVTPEFFTAIRAARNDETQRVINIAMGASTVTILLTVPVIILLAAYSNIRLPLNFNSLEIGALIFTILLAWKTTENGATDYLEGISHIIFFMAYGVLIAYH